MIYVKIIETTREHKKKIIEQLKQDAALDFLERITNESFDDKEELDNLKIEKRAIERADEIIEIVIEKLERGAI